MKTYAIKNWEDLFENADTRKLDTLRWVRTPNAHDGLGYVVLITAPDGPAMFGCWNAILQLASRGDKSSRGRLERDGRGLTPEDIALLTRMPVELVQRTLEFCSSDRIGWLQVVQCEQKELPLGDAAVSGSNPGRPGSNPGRSGSNPEHLGRIEGREGTEGRGVKEPRPMPPAKTPPASQAALPLSPSLSVVEKEKAADPADMVPAELKVPEFLEALRYYERHLTEKGETPTSFEWETLLLECAKAGISRSIAVIDFTMSRRAIRLIWGDTPRNYRPARCRMPAKTAGTPSAPVEPPGFREWLAKVNPHQVGKGLADIAPHLRAGFLEDFFKSQRPAA